MSNPSEEPGAPGAAPTRRPLPDRHLAETRALDLRTLDGRRTTLTIAIAYHPEEPTLPRELIYLAGYRSGADLERALDDLCRIVSLLLEQGIAHHAIAAALASAEDVPDGPAPCPCSLAAALLAELSTPPIWARTSSVDERTSDGRW
jgi:hypothetical protein